MKGENKMTEKFKKIYDDEHFVCPKCGGALEIGNIIGSESTWEEGIDYIEFTDGCCTKCGKEYNIDIAYKFAFYRIEDE